MATAKKAATVDELRRRLARCTIAIAADFRGLTVADMEAFRRRLRQEGVEVRVVKNTLFRRAAQEAGKPEAGALAEGPTAVAFGYGDELAPARAIAQYLRTAATPIALRRAHLAGRLLGPGEILELAEVPPREVLLGRVAFSLQAPLAHLAALLASPMQTLAGLLAGELQRFAGLLEARARQAEGSQG